MSDIVDLIGATVKLEQPAGEQERVIGTGFIIAARGKDGSPRVVLITAHHVFDRMARDKVRVGFRTWSPSHGWTYDPVNVRIRGADGEPLWTRHPTRDVAAIELPAETSTKAVPMGELPGEKALETLGVQPGDEMMVLGFPQGVAANEAGFPILRSGRVASFPLSPADRYPTYMVDFDVFAGNSGGPVYMTLDRPQRGSAAKVVVTGILTQQIHYKDQRLSIGNVTQADYISETIALIPGVEPAEVTPAEKVDAQSGAEPVEAAAEPLSARARLKESWDAFVVDLRVLAARAWIVFRDWWMKLVTPDPKWA